MRRFCVILLFSLLAAPSVLAHDPAPAFKSGVQSEAVPWTHLEFPSEDDFQFAIVADRTGGNRKGFFEDGIKKVEQMGPDFVICVGDLIEGYTEDPAELQRMRTEFDPMVQQMEMPFFYVAGNHDYTNEFMAEAYKKKFGHSYYHFVYKKTLFLVLNTEERLLAHNGSSDITSAQVEAVKKALDGNKDVRWTFVFMHKALFDAEQPVPEWKKVEDLLKDRPHTVFAGHHHTYALFERNGQEYFKLATMGGASGVMGPEVGQFDGFVWVAMNEGGPLITNLALNGILAKNIFTEEQEEIAHFLYPKKWFNVDPVVCETGPFDAGQTTLKVTNMLDESIKLHVTFDENADIEPTPCEFDLNIEPKQKGEQVIALKAAQPTFPKQIKPLKMTMTMSVPRAGRDILVLKREKMIPVLTELPTTQPTQRVKK